MAKPVSIDLGIQPQGDTWKGQSFTLREIDGVTPISLTDCEIFSKWRTKVGNVVSRDLSLSNGISIVDGELGIFRFDPADLEIKKDIHNIDIRIIFPDERKKTYIACVIDILQGETYG